MHLLHVSLWRPFKRDQFYHQNKCFSYAPTFHSKVPLQESTPVLHSMAPTQDSNPRLQIQDSNP